MINHLIKKRKKAFFKGHEYFNALNNEVINYDRSINTLGDMERYLGSSAVEVSKLIYSNNFFYEYLKYSFIGKKYDRILNFILILILLIFGIAMKASFEYFNRNLAIIISIILVVVYIILLVIVWKEESYKEYYNNTFFSLITNPYECAKYYYGRNNLDEDELKQSLPHYTSLKKYNSFTATIRDDSAGLSDIILNDTFETIDSNGLKSSKSEKIFSGFYAKCEKNIPYNVLKGNTIRIIEDDNLVSSMAEDTFKGIYESNLEYNFNSEELNKALDCRMSGSSGFIDNEDAMHAVTKIITPAFEQRMLFLKYRYNSFNMNITDNGITFWVNMDSSLYQKIKQGTFLDFKKTYKEKYSLVSKPLISLFGSDEFQYYNVFPYMEKLFVIKYLCYLYNTYMDQDNYYDINTNVIDSYELGIKNICEMNVDDFENLYKNEIKKAKIEAKNSRV